MMTPLTYEEIICQLQISRVKFEILNGRGGPIRVLGGFEAEKIITVTIPELRGIPLSEVGATRLAAECGFTEMVLSS